MVGVHYRTAYGWWRKGKLPVPAYQTPSGSIMVDVPMPSDSGGRCVVYARVSSRDQADGLDAQVARVAVWATQNGYSVAEVGSGLNGRRPKLKRVLAGPGARRSLWSIGTGIAVSVRGTSRLRCPLRAARWWWATTLRPTTIWCAT